MAGVAAIPEGDVSIEDGTGSECHACTDHSAGMVSSPDIVAGGKTNGDGLKDGEGFADGIRAVFDHLKERWVGMGEKGRGLGFIYGLYCISHLSY